MCTLSAVVGGGRVGNRGEGSAADGAGGSAGGGGGKLHGRPICRPCCGLLAGTSNVFCVKLR